MTEEQLTVNRNAITLQEGNLDLEVLIPDINWTIHFIAKGTLTSKIAFDFGPFDGIGSPDFGELDLGLDFGDGPASIGVEVGRGAPTPQSVRDGVRESLVSMMGCSVEKGDYFCQASRAPSEYRFSMDRDIDMPFGPDIGSMGVDLGLDFGDGPLSEPEKIRTRSPSRICELFPIAILDLTSPVVAETLPGEKVEGEATKVKRKPKEKMQIIDAAIKLVDKGGDRRGRESGVSDILTEQGFVPRSAMSMCLMEIREDPLAHFLPTKATPEGTYFCVGPPGLVLELTDLFLQPTQSGPLSKKRGISSGKSSRKKPRAEGSVQDEEVEQAHRAVSVVPSRKACCLTCPTDASFTGLLVALQ
ncbi:hypothetical protein EDC04DRAFT_3023554 [Pisolithus marmoratus]|nr:hypothetical protein EDC04DRAFT_3023554 [Pisolithus marmoratus]